MKKILPIWMICLLFCACRKDQPPQPQEPEPAEIRQAAGRLLILNEGNFMMGNAALSLYNAKERRVIEDVYRDANSRALGDVAQSMQMIEGQLWVVINNSGKIVVLDTSDFSEKKVITGLTSPRFLLPLSDKILVSDLYARKIQVIDRHGFNVTGNIPFQSWSEEMAINDAGVWISAPYSRFLYLVQPPYLQVTDSLEVGYRCSWLEQEEHGIISGLSAGQGNEAPQLWSIDRNGYLVGKRTLPFAAQTIHDLEKIGNKHYFLAPAGLFSVDSNSVRLEYASDGRNFYSMTWLESWGLLAIADAADYVSRGRVILIRMDAGGLWKEAEISAGIIPGRMLLFDK